MKDIRDALSAESVRIGIDLPDFAEPSTSPGPLSFGTTLEAFKGTSPTQVVQFSLGALWPYLVSVTDPKRHELSGRVTLTQAAATVVAEMRDLKTRKVMGPWTVSSADWPLIDGIPILTLHRAPMPADLNRDRVQQ